MVIISHTVFRNQNLEALNPPAKIVATFEISCSHYCLHPPLNPTHFPHPKTLLPHAPPPPHIKNLARTAPVQKPSKSRTASEVKSDFDATRTEHRFERKSARGRRGASPASRRFETRRATPEMDERLFKDGGGGGGGDADGR